MAQINVKAVGQRVGQRGEHVMRPHATGCGCKEIDACGQDLVALKPQHASHSRPSSLYASASQPLRSPCPDFCSAFFFVCILAVLLVQPRSYEIISVAMHDGHLQCQTQLKGQSIPSSHACMLHPTVISTEHGRDTRKCLPVYQNDQRHRKKPSLISAPCRASYG